MGLVRLLNLRDTKTVLHFNCIQETPSQSVFGDIGKFAVCSMTPLKVWQAVRARTS